MVEIEVESRIVQFYKIGYSKKKISRELGVSEDMVTRALIRNKIYDHIRSIPTKKEQEKIIDLYTDKLMSMRKISKATGFSRNTIMAVLWINGIEVNANNKVRRNKLDEQYFDVINTEEKAYWLGFLFADGYNNESNNTIDITLSNIDEEHLETLKQSIGSTAKISKKKINEFECCRLCVHSENMSKSLSKLGCVQGKSNILEPPKDIPEKLIRHFIRGYFDGDGSVGFYKSKTYNSYTHSICIVGTKEFLEFIRLNI